MTRWRDPRIWFLILGFCFWPCRSWAKTPLPPQDAKGPVVNDLPPPFNVQPVVVNKSVTLSWNWQGVDPMPEFTDFGYQVRRNPGGFALVADQTFSDFNVAVGSYSYQVRVIGGDRQKGKRVNHVSDWSEPVQATIRSTCPQAPSVELTVQPTQTTYASITSLRMRLRGLAQVPEGCQLQKVTYKLETGFGTNHTGSLKTNAQGQFDQLINAITADDEVPEGLATFTVSVTAEDEVGPATSDAYTISIELRNPFAPKQSN